MTELRRCNWCLSTDKMIHYHDTYWGVPLHNDQELFAKLVLDLNHAGLSWATILNKQENFYEAFDNFEIEKIAVYDENKEQELLQNAGIIRNKLKVKAAIVNAQKVLEIQKEFGSFNKYIWSFTDGKVLQHQVNDESEIPATNELSDKMSKDMKKRGFKFTGSTVIYAFLQAVGVINDHADYCYRQAELMD
ncbi:DNA-3-methyladenine glycosylase I [Lactococcus lactis subsp. lactis]|uniref:DNA-3-methyladenine glycosylase I n=1 Tax=Lactococcus lactis TaxID=1358 RepID=A0AAW7J143_9LACT|nr:DNA-3-methyladenine glycosylase I [Lactococcus lactis]MCT0060365.1 DNA-3-methyladenine glycosylase I [Lactococcus lactis subsp. lactis]MCT0136296.1 DNA-3-methyladenine glycosylase I [Lactococcus lactis subsp. lactis]MDM7546551.1 DNA-3-methyladenine glycosylase I [Lactococcus lactis]